MALILCIEDEPTLRADIADELREAGYEVLVAGDGTSGLRHFFEHRPDLVLCDITMPGMSGFEVLREMRDESGTFADIPFVFVTALADRTDVIEGKARGADDYLTKPVDYDLMLATIKARLDQIERLRAQHRSALAMQRATRLDWLTGQIGAAVRNSTDVLNHLGIGIILLGGDGTVQHVNEHGKQLLTREDGLSLRHGHLHCHSSKHTQALRRTIEAAVHGSSAAAVGTTSVLDLPRPSGARPLVVRVTTLTPSTGTVGPGFVVAVFVSDLDERPTVALEVVARVFGLTGAETRLAEKLLAGHRLDMIAEMHGVSQHTVSTQLKSIFRKTQTSRQSELIELLRRPLAWYAR